jgi:hypothetical protein
MSRSIALVALLLCVACGKSVPPPVPEPVAKVPDQPPAPERAPEPPPREESFAEILAKIPSLQGALDVTRDDMSDEFNKVSSGAIALSIWAAQRMRWTDVAVPKDETSFALVQKDSDEARGKRMCVTGKLIQIAVEKTDFGKIHEGLLMTYGYKLFHFMTVGSSGELVQDSRARICGVVTGKYDYSNSGGGTGHAVQIVGMFDLPQNRTR